MCPYLKHSGKAPLEVVLCTDKLVLTSEWHLRTPSIYHIKIALCISYLNCGRSPISTTPRSGALRPPIDCFLEPTVVLCVVFCTNVTRFWIILCPQCGTNCMGGWVQIIWGCRSWTVMGLTLTLAPHRLHLSKHVPRSCKNPKLPFDNVSSSSS